MKLLTKLLIVTTIIWITVGIGVQGYFAYLNITGHPEKVRMHLTTY